MSSFPRFGAGFALGVGLSVLASPATAQQTSPYRILDTDEGAWVDLVATSIRPMALHPQTANLWAVNSHDSTVVEYAPDGTLVRTVRVPWGPVSIAHWSDGPETDSMLVVCRNTNALARIDSATGEILSLLQLGSEPADVVVHPVSRHAFVSVAGMDMVLEVDVPANKGVRRYSVPSERPTFLALDGTDVLVAPMLSGNNSTVDTGNGVLVPGDGRVLDLEDPTIALQGLPDHDLFRITPGKDPVPVARDMGAVLFAVGVNPATGDVWQLGTEANNKDKNKVGEPAIRGEIVVNQAARAQLAAGTVVEPFIVHNLDDQDPFSNGVQYDLALSVGQPYALAFGNGGSAFVTGLLTDNVTEYDSQGAFVREWDVGSIPRGILISPAGTGAFVYLWGDNTIELYDLNPAAPAKVGTLDLGFDPTPPERQVGRALFFDAGHSMFNNASCASCHVETDSDLLAWDLSDMPKDDKGPLVTQMMRGIEDLVPLHWRGERASLIDFNGAFDGLLGGAPLDTTPGGDFDVFQDYVFSTLQPANPFQDERRVVIDRGSFKKVDGTVVNADAVNGQDLYFDFEIIPAVGSCADCHTMPTGTSNDVVFDEPFLDHARRTHFVVASFNGMWRKSQRTLERIQLANGTYESRPTIGVGVSAAGLKDDILDFVEIPLFFASDKQRRDISAFVEQSDSGIAPAVHKGFLLDSNGTQGTAKRLKEYLLRQALVRNCDIAVFGTVDLGTGPVEMRWFWNRVTARFHPEDTSVTPQSLGFFVSQALAGTGRNVFVGLPVGMAERFAVDYDADELYNADEALLGTDPFDPDSDGDGDPDGHEWKNGGDPTDGNVTSSDVTPPVVSNLRVVYATTSLAKIQFDTDEPTTFVANWSSGNLSGTVTSDLHQKTHTAVLSDLRKDSKAHTVDIDVTDLGGNTVQVQTGFATNAFSPTASVVFRNASATQVQDSSGTLHYTIAGTARRKGGTTLPGRQLRVRVFLNGVLTQTLQGTTSGGNGMTSLDVVENGLTPGDIVEVVVDTLYDVNANFGGDWSMPDTAPEMREFVLEYTGTGL